MLLAALGLAGTSACQAQSDTAAPRWPGISLHGFGTLGLTRTNTDSVEFVRDLTQADGVTTAWSAKVDSLLGLQANVQFRPDTEAVLQVVSRYHANADYRPELTWAFVRHDVSPEVALRAGRLGTEFYMLGDSRLVGYSNLSLRPPPDFYGSLVFSYIDGLDASVTLPLASGLLKGKLFAGRSPETSPFPTGITWNLRGSRLAGAYLDYTQGPWQLRLSHVQVRFEHEAPIDALLQSVGDPLGGVPYLAIEPSMAMAHQRAGFDSVGLVFDQGPLNIQLMLNKISHESPAYADSTAGYLLAGYRFGALTPYLGVSRSRSDIRPLPLNPIPGVDAITYSLVAQSYTDQTTYTLGGRWDLRKNMAIKAQLDVVRGKPISVFTFKNALPDWGGRLTAFSVALDFVF